MEDRDSSNDRSHGVGAQFYQRGSNSQKHPKQAQQQVQDNHSNEIDEIDEINDFDEVANPHFGQPKTVFGGIVDHGFDPPQLNIDSGRGRSQNMGGFVRNGDNMSLPHNHMFDIEEDVEDQLEQNYQ
uniref:Uncharacterized protein n=1 Tax=Strombidium rassoulzadegani TaxID=1082188 RepID=A0A7S3CQM7_9SPIT